MIFFILKEFRNFIAMIFSYLGFFVSLERTSQWINVSPWIVVISTIMFFIDGRFRSICKLWNYNHIGNYNLFYHQQFGISKFDSSIWDYANCAKRFLRMRFSTSKTRTRAFTVAIFVNLCFFLVIWYRTRFFISFRFRCTKSWTVRFWLISFFFFNFCNEYAYWLRTSCSLLTVLIL